MSTSGNPDLSSATTIGYLGPEGTFTEQAMHGEADLAALRSVPFASMPDVLFAVHEGAVDLGVVPIENAIEGTVNATIDTLAFDVDLLIQRELVQRVQHNLLTLPGAPVEGVTKVVSIPVATAQCRTWLRANLPDVAQGAANSTAEAARAVADGGDPSVAAIANVRAAEVYGLDVAAADIEDHPENRTRFVLVGRNSVPAPTGHDKTSIVVYQQADRPGSLLSILQEFAARAINLTLLLSRPTKTSLGDYCFLLELDGHIADEVVADCLRQLKTKQGDVKFLGSYPAAGDQAPAARSAAGTATDDAAGWLDDLRNRIGD